MSRFSQFFGSSSSVDLPTGAVAEFPSGITPTGYVELNGACLCKSTYSGLSAIVSNATPSMHVTHEVPLCGDLREKFLVDGSCLFFCRNDALTTISQWGSDCITRIDVYGATCCRGVCSSTIFRVCYMTADGISGFMDLKHCCLCCGSGTAYSTPPRYVTSFWDPRANQRIIAVGLCLCGSAGQCHHHLINFDCKCYIGFFTCPSIQPVSGPIFFTCCSGPTCSFTYMEVCCCSTCGPGTFCCLNASTFSNARLYCNYQSNCLGACCVTGFCFCCNMYSVFYESDYCFGRMPSYVFAVGSLVCGSAYVGCCSIQAIKFLSLRCCIGRSCACLWSSAGSCTSVKQDLVLKQGGMTPQNWCTNAFCGGVGAPNSYTGISSNFSLVTFGYGKSSPSEKTVIVNNIPLLTACHGGGYTPVMCFDMPMPEAARQAVITFNTSSGFLYVDPTQLFDRERCSRSGIVNTFWNPAQKAYFGTVITNTLDYGFMAGSTCAFACLSTAGGMFLAGRTVTSKSLPIIEKHNENDLGYQPTCNFGVCNTSGNFRDPSQLTSGNVELSPYIFNNTLMLHGYSNVRNSANVFLVPCIGHPCPGFSYFIKA